MSSRNDEFACFFCDYWWAFLILLMLIMAGIFTKPLWGPALFPPTPTPQPTPLTSRPTPGTGDVQVTLSWSSRNDLDLHVTDPMGEEIFYRHNASASKGVLDIDSNAGCSSNVSDQPIENIYWPFGVAPDGTYKITVVYYQNCTADVSTPFSVRVLVDGQVQEFTGQVDTQGEEKWIYNIER